MRSQILAGIATGAWLVTSVLGEGHCFGQAKLVVYPAPDGAALSAEYQVTANGQAVPVYDARINEPRNNAFASFDASGPVEVKITVPKGFRTAMVRPKSAGIVPAIDGNTISFTMSRPCKLSIELNGGTHYPLLLFANPLETNPPKEGAENVRYFGPGVHTAGEIAVKSNETVYLAGGAVVRGWVTAADAANITVRGRGIFDAHDNKGSLMRVQRCKNVVIEGVSIIDQPANRWTATFNFCDNLRIENLKIMAGDGPWSNDGIDLVSCQDAVVRDCFVKTEDDTIGIKAMTRNPADRRDVKNILVENCLLWNTLAHALHIGPELEADSIRDITFRNCDVIHPDEYLIEGIHSTLYYGVLGIINGDDGVVSNVLFDDIRIEDMPAAMPRLFDLNITKTLWGKAAQRGHVRDVTFRNINVMDSPAMFNVLSGNSPDKRIENLTFENLRIGGKVLTSAADALLNVDEATTANIRVITDAKAAADAAASVESSLEVVKPFAPAPAVTSGTVRLTLKNISQQATARGRVELRVTPQIVRSIIGDPAAKFRDGNALEFNLKPGEQVAKDFEILLPHGNYTLLTVPATAGVRVSRMPLIVQGVIARIDSINALDQVPAALTGQPWQATRYDSRMDADKPHVSWQNEEYGTVGEVRYAIAGDYLALHARVHDGRITPDVREWPDTSIDVMVSLEGSTIKKIPDPGVTPPTSAPATSAANAPTDVRQLVFHAKGGAGAITMHRNGNEQPAPEVRWQAKALSDKGYEVYALIPLAAFNLSAQTDSFLMEYAISAAPAAGKVPSYLTLHFSSSAYMDNSGFARMLVK